MRKIPSFNNIVNIDKTLFLHTEFLCTKLENTITEMLRELLF